MISTILALAPLLACSPDTLQERVATLLPTQAEQAFAAVPWELNLMRARRTADELERPIFVWIMNGHPLGCT